MGRRLRSQPSSIPHSGAGLARISSYANAVDGRGRPVQYRVEADIERDVFFSAAAQVPVFLQYAILAQQDLYLGGNFNVEETDAGLWIGGTTGNVRNANVHTNGSLGANGNPSVRGFGTYTVSTTIVSNKVDRFFDPVYNPTNAPEVRQASAVPIPSFDIPALVAARPGLVDLTVNGAMDLRASSYCTNGTCDFTLRGGTLADPFVIYVNGPLSLNGGVNIKGFVVFLVRGTTTINGNVRLGTGLDIGVGPLQLNRVAIFTSDLIDVKLNGNAQIYGQLFCGGDIRFNGTADIYGSITTGGSMTGLGNGTVHYTGIPTSMTQIFQQPETRLRLISYSEGWQ